jgi:hypothetical protein
MLIYVDVEKKESYKNYKWVSNLYHENILVLKKNKNEDQKKFFATVVCTYKCKGNITIDRGNFIYLHPNEHFEFSDNEEYIILFNKSHFDKNSLLQVSLLGPQIPLNENLMEVGYYDEENKKFITKEEYKPFKNALNKDNEILSFTFNTSDSGFNSINYFGVKIQQNGKYYMRFMSRYINNTVYRIGDPAMYIVKNDKNLFNNPIDFIKIKGSKNNGKKYQFRIFTTNTLHYIFNNDTSDEKVMKNTSGFFFDEYDNIKNITFKSIINKDNEKSMKQAFFFQIIHNGNNSHYSIVEPLYEGLKYRDFIYKGEARWYRKAKSSIEKTNVYIRPTIGRINVYQALCTAFPICYPLENNTNVNYVTKLIYAFGAFISSMESNENYHLGSQNQFIHYVRCMEEGGCEISIEYKSRQHEIILEKNENHAKFLKNSEKEKYYFFVNKSKVENKIILSLDIFSGESFIEFNKSSSFNKRLFFGTSEKYIFTNVNNTNISFTVNAKTNSYYVVSYKEIDPQNDESNIGMNGLLLQSLEKESKKKTFNFWENNPKNSNQYIANFIPLNCKINVIFQNKNLNKTIVPDNLGNHEDIIQNTSHKLNENINKYVVEFNNFLFDKSFDNYCLFYYGLSTSSTTFFSTTTCNFGSIKATLTF